MRALGIDFGTSTTVAMLTGPDGQRRPLLIDGSPLMPSAVYLDPGGRLLVGRDAWRRARVDPARFEPTPKRRVDDGVVLLGGVEVPVAQVFAAVLGQVAGEARRQVGGAPLRVRLTHPAGWGQRRRGLLTEAAALVGLSDVRLVAEPVAAAAYFTAVLGAGIGVGRSLAVYDLGGGTFDAAVVVRTPTGFDVLAQDGLVDVGGLDFDQAIVEHLGRVHGDADPAAWARLTGPGGEDRRRLYDEVRSAKETLSRAQAVDVALPPPHVQAHLTRPRFEELIDGYLRRTVSCLARTVAGAGLAAPELAGIFLVGGSSRIPLVARLIHDELLVPATALEQPETVVAEGALCLDAPIPAPRAPIPRAPAPLGAVPGGATPPGAPATFGRSAGTVPVAPPYRLHPAPGYPPGAGAGTDRIRLATIAVLVLVVILAVVLVGLLIG
jgi:molecular chaperone DnaK (HSP70)